MCDSVRAWLVPDRGDTVVVTDPAQRRATYVELLIVFATTLGLSALRSLIALADALLAPTPLDQQTATLNAPRAVHRTIDLFAQLTVVTQLLAWGGLGAYLLWRSGIRLAAIGLRKPREGDLALGAGLAVLIGVPGLALYLGSRALGVNLTVLPTTLHDTWWRIPVLVLAAAANAWAEEVLVVGYLITQLRRLGWRENPSMLTSAVLRGSYHLYQGFGGFVGNVAMGVVFGRVWQRTNRLWTLITAHTLLDVVSFVGYALLAGHVSWVAR